MKARSGPTAAIFAALLAAGCSNDGTLSGLNTSSIDSSSTQQASKQDPACLTLAAQIEALNRDGTADKVSKAAAKKYKLKTEDLAKADELNKANTEFQTKCSPYPPRPVVAATTPTDTPPKTTTTTAAPKKVAAKKTTPPVPAAKPPAPTTDTATATPPASAPAAPATPQTAENPDPTLPQP
jgi:hypothetical protein